MPGEAFGGPQPHLTSQEKRITEYLSWLTATCWSRQIASPLSATTLYWPGGNAIENPWPSSKETDAT